MARSREKEKQKDKNHKKDEKENSPVPKPGQFEVEKVVDHYWPGKDIFVDDFDENTLFKIRWKNYTEEDDTWESPESSYMYSIMQYMDTLQKEKVHESEHTMRETARNNMKSRDGRLEEVMKMKNAKDFGKVYRIVLPCDPKEYVEDEIFAVKATVKRERASIFIDKKILQLDKYEHLWRRFLHREQMEKIFDDDV